MKEKEKTLKMLLFEPLEFISWVILLLIVLHFTKEVGFILLSIFAVIFSLREIKNGGLNDTKPKTKRAS